MEIESDKYLAHYGILRKSGRYPWGSGKDPEERGRSFQSMVKELRDKGVKDVDIAKSFKMTTTELRNNVKTAREAVKQAEIIRAQRLHDKGYSNVKIGEIMGKPESSVRAMLKPGEIDKLSKTAATAEVLKQAVEDHKYIDVGSGVELHMNVTRTTLDAAISRLKDEGYKLHYVPVPQLGTGKNTTVKVLADPKLQYKEVYANRDHIQQVMPYSEDGGRSYDKIQPPLAIDLKRVAVRYAEQGGTNADGVIYVRPGVKDISLDGAHYAQVRIAVGEDPRLGGTHYLKGMAMYHPDLPEGVDLMFNTNKSSTGNKLDAMKPMKNDPENPFGATIKRQIGEKTAGGKKKLTSVMNIVNEEGDWDQWSKSLSSQMLSKQSYKLAEKQLGIVGDRKEQEFAEIKALDNPAVKRRLLKSFSDDVDAAAVHLKAAALPRQGSHVILPIEKMKPTEIYAPGFENGERVVLIRYPHGGKFEIPELVVNNRSPHARKMLGNAKDAVGIHPDVASRLSGADFDGDTVLVIPNNHRVIKTEAPLEGLKGFDPQHAYPKYDGMHIMTAKEKAFEMGDVSNLITDMTIKGANSSELARAVRHSMVVIDAEKHKLNYKQSYIDNGIAALKEKYQGKKNAGAATLISRATSRTDVRARKTRAAADGGAIDKVTGKIHYVETGEHWENEHGKVIYKTERSTKLAETHDAHTLVSKDPAAIELVYAAHSNRLKDLANRARLEMVHTGKIPYSREANLKYKDEVASLDFKLHTALRNSPLERQAQIIANAIVRQKRDANPELTNDEIKKLKSQELTRARIRTGAGKQQIKIEPNEWEAIQAGAISDHKLDRILNNADLERVKELATPKDRHVMTEALRNRAFTLLRNDKYSLAEVADALGVSVATLKRALSDGGA